mmetsp:Transcript_29498/g.5332  ORF Transcript_29498/g.5332 Transcript_29498/m.5332 type:complete len:114 (+) Transcript_29498:2006-2347(+)
MTSDRKYVINVSPSDNRYKPSSTYLILVKGTKFVNTQATYSILFTSGDGEVTLNDGVPFSDEIGKDKYKYYWFPIHFLNEDVRIKLTVESGDPDLYISVDPNNPHPDKEHFDF